MTPEEQAYQREWYQKNKDRLRRKRTPEWRATQNARLKAKYASDPEYRAYIAARNKRWRDRNPEQDRQLHITHREKKKAIIAAERARRSCDKCGESHPACLDFHHRDPSQKEHRVALMGCRGLSTKKILAELAKCDVLCANCHRKLHWGHKWQISA